ncbi:uncharacterized protein OGAPODRAFT_16075 [Ogataea polymorpha]|uniref:uncharacterized protein n=1 Tax=Ogataea polymorpha TaxID=460523 RepID=UPI0007F4B0A2|nr:uncharacterized protein OGAPODRAFT_16075 [Ogataea polymorpha]OBA16329.1 hypothetical protein OGAPODRAFT_16075 [Ogataea polymorpha]
MYINTLICLYLHPSFSSNLVTCASHGLPSTGILQKVGINQAWIYVNVSDVRASDEQIAHCY